MNIEEIRETAEMIAFSGETPPDFVAVVRYRSMYQITLRGDEPAEEEEFFDQVRSTSALAAELTLRGIEVRGVIYDSDEYHRWRSTRPDSHDLRAAWAKEKARHPLPEVKVFTLGIPLATEPIHPLVREAVGDNEATFGWAPWAGY